ncbi:MAG: PLP-dependent aminotransferase family protein [Burkholderiales bacterium]
MATDTLDYSALYRTDLPAAAGPWSPLPRFHFVGGNNDEASVPIDGLIDAATQVLRREGRSLAKYGLDSGPLGYRPLRDFIARKLKRDTGITCTPDEVLLTTGSLQGLDLVNALLVAPGDTVIIEEMTYGGAITRLNRAGAKIVGVPVDHDGLSADALSNALADLKRRGVRPKYIYTIPTVQNPTATVMSESRRQAILALSREYEVPIFEDECYADLVWSGRRPTALRALAGDSDRVIHIGSFSKSIAPALRVGYLVAGWPLMSRILPLKTDAGSGALEQMVLAEYCETQFVPHVDALRKTLRGKVETLMMSLRQHFGDEVAFDDPPGGIFLWVKFPERVDTSRLYDIAHRAGVVVNPGAEWMTDPVEGRRRIRICFAHPTERVIREGVAQLAEICHREFGVPTRDSKGHR